jgi:hypothetical protein
MKHFSRFGEILSLNSGRQKSILNSVAGFQFLHTDGYDIKTDYANFFL